MYSVWGVEHGDVIAKRKDQPRADSKHESAWAREAKRQYPDVSYKDVSHYMGRPGSFNTRSQNRKRGAAIGSLAGISGAGNLTGALVLGGVGAGVGAAIGHSQKHRGHPGAAALRAKRDATLDRRLVNARNRHVNDRRKDYHSGIEV